MTYVSTVLADAPHHFWRCADPGGSYLHDIGSAPKAMLAHNNANGNGSDVGYSGPASDGGSCTCGNNAAFACYEAEVFGYPVTAECWVWIAQQNGLNTVPMAIETVAGATLAYFNITAARTVQVYSAAAPMNGAIVLSLNAWHHLVAVCNVGATQLYVDGVLDVAAAGAAGPAQANQLGIGFAPAINGNFFAGSIAEVAVYLASLTGAQVAAHFAAADNVPSRPVFHQRGQWTLATGGTVTNSDQLAAILASVRKVF
jgi:hypothetical protein